VTKGLGIAFGKIARAMVREPIFGKVFSKIGEQLIWVCFSLARFPPILEVVRIGRHSVGIESLFFA
jgi:hypothetical protein